MCDEIKLEKALNPDTLMHMKGLEEVTSIDCFRNSVN